MMVLLFLMEKDLGLYKIKKFYCCGYSLGGVGVLFISVLIKDSYYFLVLCLYIYGMLWVGICSFVECY